jgi:hypothetical protein
MAKLTNIIIHCSDSEFGSASEIRRWHLANGWKDIGYHFVILNGMVMPTTKNQTSLYLPLLDGSVEVGRRLDGDTFITDNEAGAHALGYNTKSIGICLIGVNSFTPSQFMQLAKLLQTLTNLYGLPFSLTTIKGHYEVTPNRTCPNFNVPLFIADIPLVIGSFSQFIPARYALC